MKRLCSSHQLVSPPGHSQILSYSCGEKSILHGCRIKSGSVWPRDESSHLLCSWWRSEENTQPLFGNKPSQKMHQYRRKLRNVRLCKMCGNWFRSTYTFSSQEILLLNLKQVDTLQSTAASKPCCTYSHGLTRHTNSSAYVIIYSSTQQKVTLSQMPFSQATLRFINAHSLLPAIINSIPENFNQSSNQKPAYTIE